MQAIQKRKSRKKNKSIIRKTIPKSSSMFMLATNFKVCYLKFVNRKNCFFSRFYNWLFTKSKHSIKQCIKNNSQWFLNHICPFLYLYMNCIYCKKIACNNQCVFIINYMICVNSWFIIKLQPISCHKRWVWHIWVKTTSSGITECYSNTPHSLFLCFLRTILSFCHL